MGGHLRYGAIALVAGSMVALAGAAAAPDLAHAAEQVVGRPVGHVDRVRPHGLRRVRVAARPLTIRRRARPLAVAAAPGFLHAVPLHRWNDPRLYYFGPFRTGGDVFYGDRAGNPITRGNSELGMIAGYGAARGGYGGPHFDSVGGFHGGPGPDDTIDADYASGSLSRPRYGDIVPHYPSVAARVASLDAGVTPRNAGSTLASDRSAGRRMAADGRSNIAASEAAKAAFSAPMQRHAPPEAAFDNGGLSLIGMGDDEF